MQLMDTLPLRGRKPSLSRRAQIQESRLEAPSPSKLVLSEVKESVHSTRAQGSGRNSLGKPEPDRLEFVRPVAETKLQVSVPDDSGRPDHLELTCPEHGAWIPDSKGTHMSGELMQFMVCLGEGKLLISSNPWSRNPAPHLSPDVLVERSPKSLDAIAL